MGLKETPGDEGRVDDSDIQWNSAEMPAKMGDPDAFVKSVEVATRAVLADEPSLIVGSSFGGAVLLQLIVNGVWTGPSVFLAQAGVKYDIADALPNGLRAILIHARDDKIVPFEDSERIVANSGPGS